MLHAFRSLELRLTLLATTCAAIVLCIVACMTYLGISKILILQQDQSLKERIARLDSLLQDSQNIEQIIARPKLYQNMLGNQDNLFVLIQGKRVLININPLGIPLPELTPHTEIQFLDLLHASHPTRIAWKTIEIRQQAYILIAGKQWSERLAILSPFKHRLVVYVLTGIFAIFILCALASHYGLKALTALRHQTHAINIQKIEHRLNLDHPPQEVAQLASDINAMLDRIEMGYTQLSRFSEDLAHEFRTPLNNLIGQTEILLMAERSPVQYQELLISHLDDYQRLKRMIDSMLFLARADAQQVNLNRQPVQIQALLDKIVNVFDYQAEEQSCRLVQDIKTVDLYADVELATQALYNLVSNALIHGGCYRTISIIVDESTLHEVPMSIVSVITSDIHIAPEQLAHLFDRFYQCKLSRHTAHTTGGLGLSIVASIMKLHQGAYRAYQHPKGLCFELAFPRRQPI